MDSSDWFTFRLDVCILLLPNRGICMWASGGTNPIIGGGGIMPFRHYLPAGLKLFGQFKAFRAFVLDPALVCV
jgi:hypothetical protein